MSNSEKQLKELTALRNLADDVRRIVMNTGRSSSISKDLLERALNEFEATKK